MTLGFRWFFAGRSPKRNSLFSLLLQLLAVFCAIGFADTAIGQSTASDTHAPEVVLTKLGPLLYPPLSRQARISGDVVIRAWIRRDGTLASADVVSGHPMLAPAALKSAQSSIFECRACSEETTPYNLTYTFGFNNNSDCGGKRSRSAKCFYLWSCGGWRNNEMPSPTVTRSQDHIAILTGSPCIET
jgi:TonB family protein